MKKDASKEKVLTQTQRARFDAIFPNYHDRFRPRIPVGATTTNQHGMTTAEANTTLGAGDSNLPRKMIE